MFLFLIVSDYVEATIELGLIGEKNETKKSEKKLFSDQSSIHGCHNFMCLKVKKLASLKSTL